MQPVYVAEDKDLQVVLKIYPDEGAENPRDWDNLGRMVCWHRRYNLGDPHDFRSPEDFQEYVKEVGEQNLIMLPLYLLDHSILTISTSPFNDPWDSAQVGWIYVTKDDMRREYGVRRVTGDVLKRVHAVLGSEVEIYDLYLRGEVYGFELEKLSRCDCCHRDKTEHLDSCWGFYGSDFKANGMAEHIPKEYRHLLEQCQ